MPLKKFKKQSFTCVRTAVDSSASRQLSLDRAAAWVVDEFDWVELDLDVDICPP